MMDPIGFDPHDHADCIASGVAAVARECDARGLQLTPVRRRVLEILLMRHRALGAYEILDMLRDEGLGSQPPVAYRALDFLVSHGFVHKIERLNAFVACTHIGTSHAPAFLICRTCSSVAETHAGTSRSSLGRTARDAGFQIDRVVIEALGQCPNCQSVAAQ